MSETVRCKCAPCMAGDITVGWANSSLRLPEDLPRLDTRGRGVVLEEPLQAAFSPGGPFPAPSSASASSGISRVGGRSNGCLSKIGTETLGLLSPQQQQQQQQRSVRLAGTLADVSSSVSGPPDPQATGQLSIPSSLSGPASTSGRGLEHREAGVVEREGLAGGSSGAVLRQRHEYVLAMLARLQRLRWRRVDVCFRGSTTGFFAHNHIQVGVPRHAQGGN